MADDEELLHSLLVPLVGRRLLLPRACVAEVIGLGRFSLREAPPSWLLGDIAWSDRMVPLVSFEAACGDPVPELGGRSRAVILRSMTGKLRGGLALICQGLPQILRISEEVVLPDENGSGNGNGDGNGNGESPVLCRLKVMNETPLVPDLELLEARVAEVLAGSIGIR